MLIQAGHLTESAEAVHVTLSERDMDRVGGGVIIPIRRPLPVELLLRWFMR